ncbi:unnamed protein product [Didymodactylos carnosus]|uniref:Uncharacterized protein n=1 Tax=Didymodactylos carnosus TaxID=1234261 RepID=A0A8S2E987_9BILA|nr:unnamed protein product [Didymodactylos carnosus]CAF3863378.1 unnamed protein product [Didymodactylos carnosus]
MSNTPAELGRLIKENIRKASQIHFELTSVLTTEELKIFDNYKSIAGGDPNMLFFGSMKSSNVNILKDAAKKVEIMFAESYRKDQTIGKDKAITSSILSNVNGLSLRKALASGDKIIIADELDPILDKLGVYESKDKAEEGALLCEAFDGIRDDTRTTGRKLLVR